MDKVFIRNFFIFMLILLSAVGMLGYMLVSGDKELEKTDHRVNRTYGVILEAEQITSLIESILSSQRGYLLTGDKSFMDRYEAKKAALSETIARLSELTSDNKSQQSRLAEIRSFTNDFTNKLEERALVDDITVNSGLLDDINTVNSMKNNILRVNTAILKEEYGLLNHRVAMVERKKSFYLASLVIGMAVGTVLLLLFNAFLLNVQRKRARVEASLKQTEDRFAIAIDGTQDGIFDWDLETEKIFYSRRFFEMLGYNKGATIGTIKDTQDYIHPEDAARVMDVVEKYLAGGLSEYSQEFRMKHKSGRWVWIQSRAKAIYDKNGKALRMVGAHTDITHLKMKEEKLEAEKNQAEEANRAKSDFLAHMSHEIRTPLTAISGIAEIMAKRQDNLDEKQKQLVSTLNNSTSSLKDLVNDILDFSKIENGKLELNEEAFNLGELFESVISMMSLKANESGVSFVFDYEETKDTDFIGDAVRLRQIVVNLIGNAIKFTDEGGVTVKANFEDRDGRDFLRVDVADTGIGIAPENYDLVFERFRQADSSVSRKYGGTGLGLPISRNLARLMGGDIHLSSETGKGSTFSLLIPCKYDKGTQHENRAALEMGKKINEKLRAALTGEDKALIVEDYEGNVVVIGYILDEVGITYDVARTGLEAVNLWKDHHYDVVLMDVQMPEMDGFTATKEIRAMEAQKDLSRTPIIGMTAHALVGDKDKCIDCGMDAYLPKPIVESALKKEILKFLHKKKAA
mgnify:FL=1|tara:strand:- start:1962 stop:4193 length:2232 start_codon:yes stop_codon:yes gene_type:complete